MKRIWFVDKRDTVQELQDISHEVGNEGKPVRRTQTQNPNPTGTQLIDT